MSDPIDRGGSGVTPDARSTYIPFVLVDAIPRGPAQPSGWRPWEYLGGPPRCPKCLKWNAVAFNGRAFWRKDNPRADFHCRRCRVTWKDTKQILCAVCDDAFQTSWLVAGSGYMMSIGDCLHLNATRDPFCPRCEAIIGDNRKHCRRQLRRMVGLR